MAVTETNYVGNGSTSEFSFTFPYLKQTDIKIRVNAEDKLVGVDWDVHTATSIKFKSGKIPANGDEIKIFRDTDADQLTATFYAGSAIKSEDLNDNFLQNLYGVQEVTDRYFSNIGGTMTGDLVLSKNVDIIFEGSTVENEEIAQSITTTLSATNPTSSSKDIKLPNASGTVPVLATHSDTTISATPEHINRINSVSSNVQDQLDNKQPLDAELTELATMADTTASSLADLTQAEVQILDGATVTTDELNKLDGVTATTAELNILDGVTATTAELNYVDGVTSAIQTQLADKQPLKTPLTTIGNNMPNDVATILSTSDGNKLVATTAQINDICAGHGLDTSIAADADDDLIPTSQAVNERITDLVDQLAGFSPITNENSFPNSNPDPNNDAGTIVSIKALSNSLTSNGSGVASIANGTLDNSTVTITGLAASTTYAAGKGVLVETTTTEHEYAFHRIVMDESTVTTANTLVNNFNERYRTGTTNPSGSLHEGDLFFNTDTDKMLVYGGGSWSEVHSAGDFIELTLKNTDDTAPTYNGSVTSYHLKNGESDASVIKAQQLIVSLNGIIQKPNSGTYDDSEEGFYLTDSETIRFCTAPPSNASIYITQMGTAISINVPAANSITTAMIQGLQVDASKLASNAVTNDKILNDTISEVKLDIHADPSGTDKVLGYTSNGMEWIVAVPLTTEGDILYRDGSGLTRLPKGAAGKALIMNSGATAPEWGEAGASVANEANNRVVTSDGSGGLNGEANLSFDGSTLSVTGNQTVTTTVQAQGYESPATVSANWSIGANNNAMFPGPMTVANGVTVTVPSNRTLTIV